MSSFTPDEMEDIEEKLRLLHLQRVVGDQQLRDQIQQSIRIHREVLDKVKDAQKELSACISVLAECHPTLADNAAQAQSHLDDITLSFTKFVRDNSSQTPNKHMKDEKTSVEDPSQATWESLEQAMERELLLLRIRITKLEAMANDTTDECAGLQMDES